MSRIVSLFALAVVVGALDPPTIFAATSLQPVTPEFLEGGVLRVPSDNFTIAAPGADWVWLKAELPDDESSLYVCQRNGGGRFLLAVIPDKSSGADDWFSAVLADLKASQGRQGRVLSSLERQLSDVPAAGSYKWTAELDIPDSGSTEWHGYAVRSGRTYLLQYYGTQQELVSSFDGWAASFRILRPQSDGPGTPWATLALVTDFAALLGGAIVALLANAILRKARLNPGTLAAYAILAVVLLQTAVLWVRGLIPAGPEAAGEVLGGLVGYAFLPLLCAVGLSLLHRRRQRAKT